MTSSVAGPSYSTVRTTSASRTASAGEPATNAPSAARGSALARVRFQARTACPAFARLRAIAAPMIPVPRTLTVSLSVMTSTSCSRTEAAANQLAPRAGRCHGPNDVPGARGPGRGPGRTAALCVVGGERGRFGGCRESSGRIGRMLTGAVVPCVDRAMDMGVVELDGPRGETVTAPMQCPFRIVRTGRSSPAPRTWGTHRRAPERRPSTSSA